MLGGGLNTGRTATNSCDVVSEFTTRPVLATNSRYSGTTGGAWTSPTTLVGRLIKFSAQVNFLIPNS